MRALTIVPIKTGMVLSQLLVNDQLFSALGGNYHTLSWCIDLLMPCSIEYQTPHPALPQTNLLLEQID